MTEQTTAHKEVLTAKETAELLSVSMRTISRMEKKGLLKSYSFNDKKYYKYSEIIKRVFSESEENQKKQAA